MDAILIASANESVIDKVKSHFYKKFKIKDMGLADEFLNIWITQRPGRISIDQELYTRALLAKYSTYIGTCNYADVPSMSEYIPRKEVPANAKQQSYVDAYPYSEIVGSLLYLAVDIMYAVGVLTRHLKCPTYSSYKAACRVLSYLSHHPTTGITYTGCKLDLQVYTDSDWASDRDTRRF